MLYSEYTRLDGQKDSSDILKRKYKQWNKRVLEKDLYLALAHHMRMEKEGSRDEFKGHFTQWIEHVSPLKVMLLSVVCNLVVYRFMASTMSHIHCYYG
jgi:hypothetical protein